MKNFILLLCVILLSGCAATYNQVNLLTPTAKLISGKSVLIATPENGYYGNREYRTSGRLTVLAVNAAFAKFTNAIKVSSECKDLSCLKEKEKEPFDYYAIPEILHWEDRATEWSGIPDKIEIKLSIFESAAEKEIASTIISGKSKWATFGGDHPQDLLPEPLDKFIASLY